MKVSLIVNKFKDIGLTSYEAKSYLSLLEKDTLTVSEVSKIAGIPRTNAYEALEKLMSKGMCIARPGKVRRYSASDPSFIKEKFIGDDSHNRDGRIEDLSYKEKKISQKYESVIKANLEDFNNKEKEIIEKYRANKEMKLQKIEEEKRKKLEKYEAARKNELEKLERKRQEELEKIEAAQKADLNKLKQKQGEILAKKEELKKARLAKLTKKAKEISHEDKRIINNVENLVEELIPIYEKGRSNDKPLEYYIEVMKNPAQVNNKIAELMDEAKEEILCIEKPAIDDVKPWPPKDIENMLSEAESAMVRAIKKGVIARSIYEMSPGGKRREWQFHMLEQYAKTGEKIRIIKNAPIKTVVVDSRKIYFAIEDPILSKTSYISQIINSQGLALALKMLFEKLWMEAEDYETFLEKGKNTRLPD